MIDILKKTLFSTRLMAVLFLVFAAAMAIGTFVTVLSSIPIFVFNKVSSISIIFNFNSQELLMSGNGGHF